MKNQYYKMTRRGEFSASSPTANQCKDVGHGKYFYTLQLVFKGNTPLDVDGFLIDHFEVDKIVQSIPVEGSCEQMQQMFFEQFRQRLEIVAYKMTIKPSIETEPLAFMDYVAADKKSLLSLLN